MLNKEEFIKEFKLENAFEKSGLKWETLEAIYDDYESRSEEIDENVEKLKEYISRDIKVPIHSIRGRKKDGKHLIEKIIRKRGIEFNQKYAEIDVLNYQDIVRDLVGIRILVWSKEEWIGVFCELSEKFPDSKDQPIHMEERPIAYTRYGDRDIYEDMIYTEHTNKGYRSQHYVVRYNDFFGEIQVRTLAEEVYGEFDHRVRYPYRNENLFLLRYTSTLAQLLNSVDDIISTCYQMGEKGWDQCEIYFKKDKYIDGKKDILPDRPENGNVCKSRKEIDDTGNIDITAYAVAKTLRKDKKNAVE